jgi:serine/threonine-protein kinase
MSDTEDGSRCAACGWTTDAAYDIQYIKPGTVLAGRYLTGCYARKNGEGAVYAGYDSAAGKKVWIREYFPMTIAQRSLDTGKITPLGGCGAQYKALMSDFVDICNDIKRLGVTEPVVPIENVFSENNTVYAIYTGLDVVPLESFLKNKGGVLDYNRAISLILPVCNALGILHNHGQIHRGISPHTIYADKNGGLYLWDFALSATRTSGSELDAELFSGYTAPEQYSPNGWQGSWTDVYAMGALFYRTITGIVPPRSTRVGADRPLRAVKELRPEVPDYISDTISEAMATSTEERIQTIQTFGARLVEAELSSTAVYDVGRVVREVSGGNVRRRKKKNGDFRLVMLGLAAMLVVLCGIIVYLYMSGIFGTPGVAGPAGEEPVSEPADEGTGLMAGEVPRVIGRTYNEVIADTELLGTFTFSLKEVHDDNVPEGTIFNQVPSEGTPILGGATVVVYVSVGAESVKVPDILGLELEDALRALAEADILNTNPIPKYAASARPGEVLSVIPSAGSEFDPKKDTLIVFYAQESSVDAGRPSSGSSGSSGRANEDELDPEDYYDSETGTYLPGFFD